MTKWIVLTLGMIVATGFAQAPSTDAKKTSKATKPGANANDPFPGKKPKAPALAGGNGWVNSANPVDLDKLRGKIVLLDFWTFCCINCMQILPDLTKLEEEFANELVVVGVHSAKFTNERDVDNIRNAVMRYGIKHPVVNDSEMAIWRAYGARAWPTLVLIDPEGLIVGSVSGEGNYDVLRNAIHKLSAYHKTKGTLIANPIKFDLDAAKLPATPLRFPGKVFVDAANDRIYIADSGHNRVVVAKLSTGAVEHVVGSGAMGFKNGDFATAEFDDPQGLAAKGNVLYVADRRNHAVRKIDLNAKTVTTAAGTGKQSYDRTHGGPSGATSLASPWDVLWIDDSLYIAMAGLHQIWKLDLNANTVAPFAGSGREDIINGDRQTSAFAQPSGLSTDGKSLYVADSEVSAVRRVDLSESKVQALVGEGLFDFGDHDGPAARVRLQHALGVAYADGKVYVADTYNNKIKWLDAKTGDATTLLGDGWAGSRDKPARFDHPGGICFADGKLYVADTNNHAIRIVDLATGSVAPLQLSGLNPPGVANP